MSRGDRLDAGDHRSGALRGGAPSGSLADVAETPSRRGEGTEPTSLATRPERAPGVELAELVGGEDLDELQRELIRGGLRDSSIQRYLGVARAWKRYCADRHEPFWDASTMTLLRWLDWRVRQSQSPAAALKMSLAAARALQRGYSLVHQVEPVPYATRARVQLDAYARSCTMNRSERKIARPLHLDELDEVLRRLRSDDRTRWGVSLAQGTLLQARDAALLLIGWWGALRADDLARVELDDLHVAPLGLEIHLRASKTTHALLALAARPECPRLCPVEALRRLNMEREASGDAWRKSKRPKAFASSELVFNLVTGDHVGRRIANLFERYGLPKGYTGHSLRAGFATECALQNVPDKLVQHHGRWRSAQQHAEYVRMARLWTDTPTTRLVCPVAA